MPDIILQYGLKKWATKKFVEHCSTMEMMASVENRWDIEAIAIVALLEVDPAVRYNGMNASEAAFVKCCHRQLDSLSQQTDWPVQLPH